jgi:hypothetical protein
MLEIFIAWGKGGGGLGLAYSTCEQTPQGMMHRVDKGCKKGDIRPCVKKARPVILGAATYNFSKEFHTL